jgi:alkanesulfonate monooxygenase SsuD/methylene tetrahydromethanopterin reductase-like flavin-dependent oxidoreductase (luciferase family)
VKAAERIEALEFESILVWDHYMLPASNWTLEVWPLLAYLASKTSTVKLGTCVTPIPFRPPSILAKMIATVDQLSDGRVILGVGAGWHKPEFEGYSNWDGSKVRFEKTVEGLEVMTRLWAEDSTNFTGKYYQLKDAVLEPKPIQKPHPPLWFGTVGVKMMKTMIKYGNGWIPTGISPERYGELVNALRMERKQIKLAYFDRAIGVGGKGIANVVEQFSKAGCQYFLPHFRYESPDSITELEKFSKEIVQSYR